MTVEILENLFITCHFIITYQYLKKQKGILNQLLKNKQTKITTENIKKQRLLCNYKKFSKVML